jgi:uncharacterized protein YutE (UPF0331/DUF86 family)
MSLTLQQDEIIRLNEVANEYKSRGYSVFVNPKAPDLPNFLVELQPAMIVKNKNENIVVEVKTHASLKNDSTIQRLAEVIQNHPDWRFELVMISSGAEQQRDADPQFILGEVGKLQNSGYNDAALLLVWGAIEIGLRRLAKKENIELEKKSPEYLIKELTSLGLLDDDVYNVLWEAKKSRNAIAHGYKTDEGENEAALVDDLLKIAKSLI